MVEGGAAGVETMDARAGEARRRLGRGGHVVVTEEDVRGAFHVPITEAAKRVRGRGRGRDGSDAPRGNSSDALSARD